jgi:hypothetical protein
MTPTCDRCAAPLEDARAAFCLPCRTDLFGDIVQMRDALRAQIEWELRLKANPVGARPG